MTPKIIRTLPEFDALDPDALVGNFDDFLGGIEKLRGRGEVVPSWVDIYLPVVVIATGEQVRAAQQALEEA